MHVTQKLDRENNKKIYSFFILCHKMKKELKYIQYYWQYQTKKLF